MRVSPDTGTPVAVDSKLSAGRELTAIAYDRNDAAPGTPSTLYALDYEKQSLVRIGGVDAGGRP